MKIPLKISDIKIGTKLYFGFGSIILILYIMLTVAYVNSSRLADANTLNIHSYETQEKMHDMIESLVNIQTSARGYALTSVDSFLEPMEANKKAFDEHMEKAKKLTANNPEQQTRLEKLQNQKNNWIKVAIEPMLKLRRGVSAGVMQFDSLIQFEVGRGDKLMNEIRATLSEITAVESELLTKRTNEVAALQKMTITIFIGGGLIAIVIAFLVAITLIRSIITPLSHALDIAKKVSIGNLASDITVTSKDEAGELMQALKEMNDSLVTIVSMVQVGTDAIATASGQIAAGNLNLASSTQVQVNSPKEVTASTEELTHTVQQNAASANQANQLASSASEVAVKGGTAVMQVVDTMNSINESSKKIVDIIGVIDGIAFQTNILALNAAVEAARAGEQGRGFAVVATEVRNLAQRSAVAAKEIKALIADSAGKVEVGSKLVAQAGSTMEEIVSSVKRVTDIMGEIASASQDQIDGIDKINRAISNMSQSTQQNAALVQDVASTAESMQKQTKDQADLMSVFKHNGVMKPVPIPLPQDYKTK